MEQTAFADQCAHHFKRVHYDDDTPGSTFYNNGVSILLSIAEIWTQNASFTPALKAQLIDHIKDATIAEQYGLSLIIYHCLGDLEWYLRDNGHDSTTWDSTGFIVMPLVWAFRMDLSRLRTGWDARRKKWIWEWSLRNAMITAQSEWRVTGTNNDDQAQKDELKQFITTLKSWGKLVAHYNVAFRTDRGDGDGIIVRIDHDRRTVKDQYPHEVIPYCRRLFIQCTSFEPSIPDTVILRDGFDTLNDCANKIDSRLATRSIGEALGMTIGSLQGLKLNFALHFCQMLNILCGCDDWPTWDMTAAVTGDEKFVFSSVLWAIRLGPIGISWGLERGRSVLEVLRSEERQWIDDNRHKAGFEDTRKHLMYVVDELRLWGAKILKRQTSTK